MKSLGRIGVHELVRFLSNTFELPAPNGQSANIFHTVGSLLLLILPNLSSSHPLVLSTLPSSSLPIIDLCREPRNESCTLSSIAARGIRQMSRRDSKSTGTDLIASRAEDLDLAGVDAEECLTLKWVAEGDNSLSSYVSFLSLFLAWRRRVDL